MKRCPACGNAFPFSESFCPTDGSVLVADNAPTVVTHHPTPGQTPVHFVPSGSIHHQPPPSDSGLYKIVLPLAGVVVGVVLVLGVVITWKVLDSSKESGNAGTPVPAANTAAPANAPAVSPPTAAPAVPAAPATAQIPGTTMAVNSPGDGFLSLKAGPDVNSSRLMKIPHGTRIVLAGCDPAYLRVDGRNGRWCRTTFAGYSGWVFDGFLRP